jgi:uncharacterized protein (UPF0335 family)
MKREIKELKKRIKPAVESACKRQPQEKARADEDAQDQSLESKNEEVKQKTEEVERLRPEKKLLESKIKEVVKQKMEEVERLRSGKKPLESKIKEVKQKGEAEEEVEELHRCLRSCWKLQKMKSNTNPKGKGKRKRSHEDTSRFLTLHECQKGVTYLCCWLCQYVKVVPESKFQVPQKKLPEHLAKLFKGIIVDLNKPAPKGFKGTPAYKNFLTHLNSHFEGNGSRPQFFHC